MRWLHFILSHSIFIAFCAVAMAFQTTHLLNIAASYNLYGFIFFATLSSYNFYWLVSKLSFSQKFSLVEFIKKERMAVILLIISAIGFLFFLWKHAIQLPFILTAAGLTVLYAIPILPFSFLKFTRKAGVLKTVLLAFTWMYVTGFLPLHKGYDILQASDYFVLSRRFLFMLMLCIIFDNRDKEMDKIRGLRSLATDLHANVLKGLIFLIFIVLFATNFFYALFGLSLAQSIGLQVSTSALLFVYYCSTKKQGYLFYYFVVDGMMLFSALATYIAGN